MGDPLNAFLIASGLTPYPMLEHKRETVRAAQVPEALALIQREKRPVSAGFLSANLEYSLFGSTIKALKEHPDIRLKRHKGKTYFCYRGTSYNG